MVSTTAPVCDFGLPAVDFSLRGVDDVSWSLKDCCGDKGLLVMFICNHCPYVRAILGKLVADCREIMSYGIGCVAISSNDAVSYPEDSFENMQKLSIEYDFPFPYLYDETQQTAKLYGAVCTPDFFGYNKKLELQYRGRFDDSARETKNNSTHELLMAMSKIAMTGKGPADQTPSIGCSIKWR